MFGSINVWIMIRWDISSSVVECMASMMTNLNFSCEYQVTWKYVVKHKYSSNIKALGRNNYITHVTTHRMSQVKGTWKTSTRWLKQDEIFTSVLKICQEIVLYSIISAIRAKISFKTKELNSNCQKNLSRQMLGCFPAITWKNNLYLLTNCRYQYTRIWKYGKKALIDYYSENRY